MEKVQMVYMGKLALVDKDQVSLLLKKEALCKEAAIFLNADLETRQAISAKIIKLNRRIRKNVQFL